MARSRRMSAQKRLREHRKVAQAELKHVTNRTSAAEAPRSGPLAASLLGGPR